MYHYRMPWDYLGLSLPVRDLCNALLLFDAIHVKGRGPLEREDGDTTPSFINKLRSCSICASQVGVTAGSIFPGNSGLSKAFIQYFIVIG